MGFEDHRDGGEEEYCVEGKMCGLEEEARVKADPAQALEQVAENAHGRDNAALEPKDLLVYFGKARPEVLESAGSVEQQEEVAKADEEEEGSCECE